MEEIAKIITNYGLPAGLLIFVLVRVDQSVKELKDEMSKMREEMIKNNERIDQICERRKK